MCYKVQDPQLQLDEQCGRLVEANPEFDMVAAKYPVTATTSPATAPPQLVAAE